MLGLFLLIPLLLTFIEILLQLPNCEYRLIYQQSLIFLNILSARYTQMRN